MDKKLRNLVILAGILVLLCAGYAAVGLMFPKETPAEDATETPTDAASAYLFSVTEDGLTALSFTYDKDGDGEAETWSYTRSADGKTWSWSEDASVPLSSSAFYGYSATLAGITPIKTLTGVTPDKLAEYGLDEPAKTVTFTDAAGGAQSFWIGAYSTYSGAYCVCKNGDTSTVYLVDGEFYAEFERGVESLVNFDDLPEFDPEDLVSLTLTRGERTVEVTRTAEGTEKAVWLRSVNGEAPVAVAPDLGDSLELLAGDMDYLTCYSVRESSFEEYGLSGDTVRMTLVYRKTVEGEEVEKTFTLTLGDADKYGYYYANPEGTTLTMLLGGSVFHKLMTYDDDRIAAGDAVGTDTVS